MMLGTRDIMGQPIQPPVSPPHRRGGRPGPHPEHRPQLSQHDVNTPTPFADAELPTGFGARAAGRKSGPLPDGGMRQLQLGCDRTTIEDGASQPGAEGEHHLRPTPDTTAGSCISASLRTITSRPHRVSQLAGQIPVRPSLR